MDQQEMTEMNKTNASTRKDGWIVCGIGERRKVKVTIESVSLENIGDEDKPVVYFTGKTKGLVLNKTNAGRISAAYGDETDGWSGKEIHLFVEQVLFSGRMVPAIRVEVPMEIADERERITCVDCMVAARQSRG